MKLGAIILARLDSTRLPGKALKKIGSKPLIGHCISRLKNLKNITPVLATSNREIDAPLIEMAKQNDILYFQGSVENVALRVVDCVNYYGFEYFARINGDSPFIPVDLLSMAIKEINLKKFDFVTNLLPRSFPYGISVEVFNSTIFRKGYNEFKGNKKYEEHISSFFYDKKEKFNFLNIENEIKFTDENSNNIRLVVDTMDDFSVITRMNEFNNRIFEEDLATIYRVYRKAINDH